MVATCCTAPLRLEKTTNKNMHSRGNTATYHYYANVPLLCGIAAFLFFFRGIAANVFAALPLLFCCGIAANAFAVLPFAFRGIFAALPLWFSFAFFCSKLFVTPVPLIAKISTT